GELVDLLVDDPETKVILLFLETIRDAASLARASDRAFAAGKPVVAYKLGRSHLGEVLARSHTGALAGSDAAAVLPPDPCSPPPAPPHRTPPPRAERLSPCYKYFAHGRWGECPRQASGFQGGSRLWRWLDVAGGRAAMLRRGLIGSSGRHG
ncbi:MAG: hypothetical protein ACOYK7_11070, partial [Pirellulales bacterium]